MSQNGGKDSCGGNGCPVSDASYLTHSHAMYRCRFVAQKWRVCYKCIMETKWRKANALEVGWSKAAPAAAAVLSSEGHTRVMQDRMEMAGSVKKGEMIVPDFSSCQGECLKRGYLRLPVEIGLGNSLSSPLGTITRTIALRTAPA